MFKRLFKKIFYCVTCSIIVSVIFCFIFLKGSNKTGAVTEIQYNNTRLEKNSGNKDNIKDIYLEKEIKDIKNKYSDKKCLKIYNKNKDMLILANRNNPLPDSYTPSLRYICN